MLGYILFGIVVWIFLLQRKCEQYWPEHMNTGKPYGDITVTWIDTEQTSDFCIRTFSLTKVQQHTASYH